MTKTIEVTMDNGERESVEVKQIKVSQYSLAFAAYEKRDEPRLIELSTGKHAGWALMLSGPSYTQLALAFREVNSADFFGYVVRMGMDAATKELVFEQFRNQSRGLNMSPTSGRGQG